MPPRGPSKENLEPPLPASLGVGLKSCRTLFEDFRKRKTESDFHFNGEHRQNSIHINCSNIFLDQSPKVKETEAKISKWALIKLKSFCTAKLCKTEQKDNLQMGEGICKWCNWYRLIFQRIQTAYNSDIKRKKIDKLHFLKKLIILKSDTLEDIANEVKRQPT